MRIAITGASGKTALAKEFVNQWKNYEIVKYDFPEDVDFDNPTKKSQWAILNTMVDALQNTKVDDNVIFDSCPLDNMMHTLRAYDKENDIGDPFVNKCIPVVREISRRLDVIFYIPSTSAPDNVANEIKLDIKVKVKTPDIDPEKMKVMEIDNLFKAVQKDYHANPYSKFFVKDDRVPLIEIFGESAVALAMIKQYIDDDGDAIGETSIIDPNTLDAKDMESNIDFLSTDEDIYV